MSNEAAKKLAEMIDRALYYAGQGTWPLPDPDNISLLSQSKFAAQLQATVLEVLKNQTHDKTVTSCAKFRGWRRSRKAINGHGIWEKPKGEWMLTENYDPTADTPEGREQAENLESHVIESGYDLLWIRTERGCCVEIYKRGKLPSEFDKMGDRVFEAEGLGGNKGSALSSAVAELVEKEGGMKRYEQN